MGIMKRRGLFWMLTTLLLITFMAIVTQHDTISDAINMSMNFRNAPESMERKSPILTSLPNHTHTEAGRRMNELRERIRQVCVADKLSSVQIDKQQFTNPMAMKNDQYKMMYFPIPKVGCSWWKRIFKVLEFGNGSQSVFDTPGFAVHEEKSMTNTKNMNMQNVSEMRKLLFNYTSFIFVRDPFARLFSGYIDKILIPNGMLSRHAVLYYGKAYNRMNCGLNITFPAFAQSIADAILNNKMTDNHFYPMWAHCNPCEMNITFIGKMETFMADTKYITSSLGLDINKLTGVQSDDGIEEKNDKGNIEDLARRTYPYMIEMERRKTLCISRQEVLERIWRIYQMRGYLSKHQPFPVFKNAETATVDDFIAAAKKAYDTSGPRSDKLLQRKEAMMEAFSMVPKPTLVSLSSAYYRDCRIFDYSCDIEHRFLLSKQDKRFYFQK